jgi:hypothetical protein
MTPQPGGEEWRRPLDTEHSRWFSTRLRAFHDEEAVVRCNQWFGGNTSHFLLVRHTHLSRTAFPSVPAPFLGWPM